MTKVIILGQITPDELIGAIKYDLAANGCNYPIEYKTHVEGEMYSVFCGINWTVNKNQTSDPTLDDWIDKQIGVCSNYLPIHSEIEPEDFTDEVIRLSSDIQEFIKSENLTV